MIITFTANPSIDFTLNLDEPLNVGQVQRARTATSVAGGKGINVSMAVYQADFPTVAVFPSSAHDQFLSLLAPTGLSTRNAEISGAVRTNSTITDPAGVTTKLNGPGPTLGTDDLTTLEGMLIQAAASAHWVVLAGSLPPGAPADWYPQLIAALRKTYPSLPIAVDTSDAPMIELGANFSTAAPTLIKPNGFELGQLIGKDGAALEQHALDGDFSPVVAAAREVNARGVDEVFVTLGAAGAVLSTPHGAWRATPPPTVVESTVGAGDSSLAGYLLGRCTGLDFGESLRQGVAYGSAAASLPGTTIPSPGHVNINETLVFPL